MSKAEPLVEINNKIKTLKKGLCYQNMSAGKAMVLVDVLCPQERVFKLIKMDFSKDFQKFSKSIK